VRSRNTKVWPVVGGNCGWNAAATGPDFQSYVQGHLTRKHPRTSSKRRTQQERGNTPLVFAVRLVVVVNAKLEVPQFEVRPRKEATFAWTASMLKFKRDAGSRTGREVP
jgi:hypothetical protein